MKYAVFNLVLLLALSCRAIATEPENMHDVLREEVRATEQAFADTMKERDVTAFAAYIDEQAIFFAGDQPLRGKARVVAAWTPLFEGVDAPFSWQPKVVEVLDSGELAISSGPVFDGTGKQIAVFNSIWRRHQDGQWRIIFDRGADYCP